MILKYQQGGSAVPPLVSYQPVTVTGGRQEAPVENDQENANLTDKDLLTMLEKLDGLPSDMAVLTQTLQNFYIDQQYDQFPNTSNIASRYLQALSQMKEPNFNKKEYDDAFQTVSKNGGINELAITDRGQLFCVNSEGDFQLMTLSELKSNSDYNPLTNSELLYYRAQLPQLANNNEFLKVVKNGIGMESVTKMIQDSIGNLGTTSESNEGFARSQASQLLNGLQDFINAQQQSGSYNASVDNLYKGKLLTKNQAMQAKAALSYIYNTLPINAKTLLKTKTQSGTDKEAEELVWTLISSKLSSTTDFQLDLDDSNSSSRKSNQKGDLDADLILSIQAGDGGHDSVYTLNNKDSVGMTVKGTAYEQIKDTQGNHIGRTSVENLLNDSGLRSIINADNGIYFGNQRVDLDSLLNIAYDGKGLLRVNLPVRSDGSPNFDLLEEYSKAESEFLLSSQTDEDRLRIFGDTEKYPGLTSLITQTGELDYSKFAPFIVVSGMTTDNMVDIDESNKFVTEVKQTPELVKQLKTSLSIGSGKNIQYPDIDEYGIMEAITFGLNDYDHIMKGNIYIPINMNKRAAALGGNQSIDTTTGQMLEKEYQQRDIAFQKLDPSILFNN